MGHQALPDAADGNLMFTEEGSRRGACVGRVVSVAERAARL